jgi:hypothetical protein
MRRWVDHDQSVTTGRVVWPARTPGAVRRRWQGSERLGGNAPEVFRHVPNTCRAKLIVRRSTAGAARNSRGPPSLWQAPNEVE